MRIGIIGLPNVGKSTLFNALTRLSVPAHNYPFTTIDPNIGDVPVPDARLRRLGELFKPERLTPSHVSFVDIAGLVKGASTGEGLGNRFLAHIREMDALVHVVRCFTAGDVVNTLGRIDPMDERLIVETELMLADLEQARSMADKYARAGRAGDKAARALLEMIEAVSAGLDKGIPVRAQGCDPSAIAQWQFLTAKPVLYVMNTDAPDAAVPEGYLGISARIESEIVSLPDEEQAAFRAEMSAGGPGLDRLIAAAHRLLDLVTFYTVVGTEVRAWDIPRGTAAQQAAGRIHTDMAEGFIRADVYAFSELERCGSEKALQEKGLIRSEGREYPVQDGDVVRIHFRA